MMDRPDFDDASDTLARLWDSLLSRQPERVRAAFEGLSPQDQQAVLAHLRKMAAEPGWHTEQQRSARAALGALETVD